MIEWNIILANAIIITGITEWTKSFDKQKKIKTLYKFIPLLLSFGTGAVVQLIHTFQLGNFLFISLVSFAFSIIGYETIIKFVHNITKKIDI